MSTRRTRINTYRYYFVARSTRKRYVYVQMHLARHFCAQTLLRSVSCAAIFVASCVAQANNSADWPMFRGSPALVGIASGKLDSQLTLLWSFKTEKPVKSSPAISNNRVFVGSD